MRAIHFALVLTAATWFAVGDSAAFAEPMFLARQYARCSTCHYSASGGGLLTPYGRSLSHRELSTTGERPLPSHGQETPSSGEDAFLWGALGERLGPVQLGIELRPARLHYSFGGFSSDRNLLMDADVIAAVRTGGWTIYGEVGRQPLNTGSKLDSYEYWVGHESEAGLGFRVGRFFPAYGVHFADHTSFNRSQLGLAQYDQVFGLEVSRSKERSLFQVSLSPGRADSIIDDDGRRAFTASGRYQVDVSPRTVLVASGLFRDESALEARSGAAGVAFGVAPASRLSVWTQADTLFRDQAAGGRTYVVVNETAFEAYRGVWLKLSPQMRTGGGDATPDLLRLAMSADFLPRTHWNVDVSYYRDRNRTTALTTTIFLAQLHLYL